MKYTFNQIYNSGTVIFQNELLEHRHDEGILSRYDSNFIQFKRMPTEIELLNAIDYLTKFHQARGQHFVKFKFPANEVLPKKLVTILEQYTIGFLELYVIQPSDFKGHGPDVAVQFVEQEQLADFLQLQYEEDLKFGEQYAKEKQSFLLRERNKKGHSQIIAYQDGTAIGSVELIETKDTVEIDNFFVIESKRGQGFGTAMQQFIMNYAKNKTVILVADGEDDVRNMYKKQGYSFKGFQYEALRQWNE